MNTLNHFGLRSGWETLYFGKKCFFPPAKLWCVKRDAFSAACLVRRNKKDPPGTVSPDKRFLFSTLFIPSSESQIFRPERDSIYAATRSVSTMSPPREVREFAPLEKRPPNLVSTQPKTGAGSNNKAAAFQDLKNLMSTSHSGMTHYTCGMCTDRLSLTNKMRGESLAWIRSQQIMAGQERIVGGTGGDCTDGERKSTVDRTAETVMPLLRPRRQHNNSSGSTRSAISDVRRGANVQGNARRARRVPSAEQTRRLIKTPANQMTPARKGHFIVFIRRSHFLKTLDSNASVQ